uniref:Filamin binding LIM protein 1 n=1 Tax=Cyclopterus lumpus TaxID=8103 RepID=A0A8C2Z9D4_CYCLU
MASAAPPKRMVSSVFITLAAPHRATVTQQQPVLQAHSGAVRDKPHTAVRVSPSDNVPAVRHKKEDDQQSESHGRKGRTFTEAMAPRVPSATRPTPAPRVPSAPRPIPAPRVPSAPRPIPAPRVPSAPRPPPVPRVTSPPRQTPVPRVTSPPRPTQAPCVRSPPWPLPASVPGVPPEPVCSPGGRPSARPPEQVYLPGGSPSARPPGGRPSARSPEQVYVPEALNRTYHDGCFQCRSCHIPLAGKQYYNKAGIPLCEDCYQASLELCWACGEVIADHVIRALERAYHLSCFTCATCKQQIGEKAFAQGEVGEVYCLQDYYRKYAPKCYACNKLIIPKEDGTDSYNVECLGHSYHENCYRCEVCVIQLSPEPNEHGCYPLDGKLLCKSCHLNLISGQH